MLHEKIASTFDDEAFTCRAIGELPAKLSNEQLLALRRFAKSSLPEAQPCGDAAFGKAMAIMEAALVSRGTDDLTGRLKYEAYQRKLGHLPREAIGVLVSRCLDRCKYFPTIAECLTIIDDWESEARRARSVAQAKIAKDRQERLEEARDALKWGRLSQAEVDALPDRWKVILECESWLRLHPDGRYSARAPLFRSDAEATR